MCAFNVLNELLKFLRDKLRAIISNNPWFCQRVFIFSFLSSKFYIIGRHCKPYLMMKHITGITVNYRNQEQERSIKVQILNIRVPVFMRTIWLLKTCSFKICLLYTSPSPRDRQKSR